LLENGPDLDLSHSEGRSPTGSEPAHLKDSPIIRKADPHVGTNVGGVMPTVVEADFDYIYAVGDLVQYVEQIINTVGAGLGEVGRLPPRVPASERVTITDLEQEPALLARAEARGPEQEVIVSHGRGPPQLALPRDLSVQGISLSRGLKIKGSRPRWRSRGVCPNGILERPCQIGLDAHILPLGHCSVAAG
jgi:hypothetical protein